MCNLKKFLTPFFCLVAFAIPASAFATVQITEIMYDAPGSDSGREWIEIANTGTAATDIYGYKLFEGGVNHGISVVSGTTTLAAGEVAVITNNAQKFLEDFPHYTGTIFKSSFSLSNTGETLVIKDNLLTQVVRVSYISAQGADGDGNSLHKNDPAWISGAPNPGSLVVTAAIKPAPAAPAVKTSASAVKITAVKKSSNSSSNSSQATAVGESNTPFQTPALPQNTALWTTVLGLAALIAVGVGGALYVRGSRTALNTGETAPTAEEFDIS